MPAFSIEDQMCARVQEIVQQQSFTDQIGFAVSWERLPAPSPAGMQFHCGWTIMLTLKTGILGRDLLTFVAAKGTHPPDAALAEPIIQGIEMLRQARTQAKTQMAAPSNGHGKLITGR